MLAALDVCYHEGGGALAAAVLFETWESPREARAVLKPIPEVAPYEPGAFYKRELPCLLRVLEAAATPLEAIVIDGYVWLSADARPGLGAHLFEALGEETPIIGVAKTSFQGSSFAETLIRGRSASPLYITAAGMKQNLAADAVRRMSGPHRIPDLLKRVDRLCRDGR
ncbi:MAG: endonuclease V [Byssovorax sp.]